MLKQIELNFGEDDVYLIRVTKWKNSLLLTLLSLIFRRCFGIKRVLNFDVLYIIDVLEDAQKYDGAKWTFA